MCFSATASFAAGIGLTGIGLATTALAPTHRTRPFAAIPLLFGLQQLAEGGLWLALRDGDTAAQSCFTAGFLSFAEVIWPVYAPLAVWLIEPDARRRRAMAFCLAAGGVIALALLYGLATQFQPAVLKNGHIFYGFPHYNWFRDMNLLIPSMTLYSVATCLSLTLASDRLVAVFGLAVAASLAFTFYAYEEWLISVWCFFAAALSGLVAVWVSLTRGVTLRVRTS